MGNGINASRKSLVYGCPCNNFVQPLRQWGPDNDYTCTWEMLGIWLYSSFISQADCLVKNSTLERLENGYTYEKKC